MGLGQGCKQTGCKNVLLTSSLLSSSPSVQRSSMRRHPLSRSKCATAETFVCRPCAELSFPYRDGNCAAVRPETARSRCQPVHIDDDSSAPAKADQRHSNTAPACSASQNNILFRTVARKRHIFHLWMSKDKCFAI